MRNEQWDLTRTAHSGQLLHVWFRASADFSTPKYSRKELIFNRAKSYILLEADANSRSEGRKKENFSE